MGSIIENTSSNGLLAALNANVVAFWSTYGRGVGCTLQTTPKVVWFYTGIQRALFNGVLSANMIPDEVKPVIDRLQVKIDEIGAPALWWIGPQSTPENIGTILENFGIRLDEEVPAMAIDLDLVDNKQEMLEKFTILEVNSPEMQRLWTRIACEGTGFSETATNEMDRIEANLCDAQYKAQHRYIGFLGSTPVATSAMVLEAGVAGMYGVATIPEARRKGIGRIMTVQPLLEAKEMGYQVGILTASPMGYPIYIKIGFKDVFKYSMYLQVR